MVDVYEHVGELAVSIWWIEKCPKDVGGQFIQNVDTYLLHYMASHTRTQYLSDNKQLKIFCYTYMCPNKWLDAYPI
jgi:hypothetical protein